MKKESKVRVGELEYVDLDSASEITGYERFYIRRLAADGKIRATQIGATWLVNVQSIEEYRVGDKHRSPRPSTRKEKAQ